MLRLSRCAPRALPAVSASVRYRSTMLAADRLPADAMYTQREAESAASAMKPAELVSRAHMTAEVIVSKIFPAGFGWQAASIVAGQQGFEADTLSFALTTGAGDFLGVFLGHSTLALFKSMTGKSDDLNGDLVTGLWLASAAFCSGTAWQPVVNFLHDAAGCSFAATAVGCGAATGASFFMGLRIGRVLFKPLGLPGADYANLCGDAMLSASIGAATGTFVGTDVSFADNMLAPMFGVTDGMTDIEGMIRAGASTSTGFLCLQSLQNTTLPRGANWIDPVKL